MVSVLAFLKPFSTSVQGNFEFATAKKSSTTTRFFSLEFLQSETFFHVFIYILHLCKHDLVELCKVVVSF